MAVNVVFAIVIAVMVVLFIVVKLTPERVRKPASAPAMHSRANSPCAA